MSTKTNQKLLVAGGWSPYESLTKEDEAVFKQATEDVHGIVYKPISVSKQVVQGTNYRFRCEASAPPALVIWETTVDIFKPLDGSAHIEQHHRPILELAKQLAIDKTLQDALVTSINKAKHAAQAKLNPELYSAIDEEFKGFGWPINAREYIAYITQYSKIIPNEISSKKYPNAWKSDGTKNGHNQKVFDLLCQFYWLINQEINVNGKTIVLQNYENPATGFYFANWVDNFDSLWGEFLNTPPSLTEESLASFEAAPPYHVQDSSEYKHTWNCFNDFFYRQLNGANPETGISPLRPIAAPDTNNIIAAPADATYRKEYDIDKNGNIPGITLKHTHEISSIEILLDGSPYANDFNNGTFVHYFLSPFDYHRFHTPVFGKILECRPVQGKAYLDVTIIDDASDQQGQFDAPDGAENGYEFTQARGIVIMETQDIGKVAIIPVGMAQVSSVHMYDLAGKDVCKGYEFGKFAFGGSDIILLFEENKNLELFKYDTNGDPIHFKYGEKVARWS